MQSLGASPLTCEAIHCSWEAHIKAQQAQHVLGCNAVALALERAGLKEGVCLRITLQPGRPLPLPKQPQILCSNTTPNQPPAGSTSNSWCFMCTSVLTCELWEGQSQPVSSLLCYG
jgi:hypothetical protein